MIRTVNMRAARSLCARREELAKKGRVLTAKGQAKLESAKEMLYRCRLEE